MADLVVQKISIDRLIPYWRNPRKNDVAVEKVKASIQEFGYQAPIIVDANMTIVAGHTRYRALKELGYTKVDVVITDLPAKKAKEFRIIDNRTSEYAQWSADLTLELKEFTSPEFLDIFFPDVKLDPDFAAMVQPNKQENIDQIAQDLEKQFEKASEERNSEPHMTIPCPNCLTEITLLKKDLVKAKNWDI
jgi:ParB-like nuclease domain